MPCITNLITFEQQMRICHWSTNSYARHMAYDGIYSSLSDLIDKFVEEVIGQFGRDELKSAITIKLDTLDTLDINKVLDGIVRTLTVDVEKEYAKSTNILNIRDEILGEIRKLRYSLTLY